MNTKYRFGIRPACHAGLFAGALVLLFVSFPAQAATYSTVYTFCSQQNCADGSTPRSSLLNVNGTFYGTTTQGGAYGYGTAFSLDPTTGAETVLHSFGSGMDGQYPYADLIDVKGTLYGTTIEGGKHGYGTVFGLDPKSGVETVLHSFGKRSDGRYPYADLLDVSGKLYGTTAYGGAYNRGTVFSLNPRTGREVLLHSFAGDTDGQHPYAGLLNVSGTLYGTTAFGGANSAGTVFTLDPSSGAETVLYSFGTGSDGQHPYAALIDAGSTLYGTTVAGGTYGYGTAFLLDLATAMESPLYSFGGTSSDGLFPYAGLIEASGTLYGTNYDGGTGGWGTAFSLDPDTGAETILANFGTASALPYAGLIDVDGTLYGTAATGGTDFGGVVFSIVP